MIVRPVVGPLVSPIAGAVTGLRRGGGIPSADYYVSNEATNGYVVGVDTNNGQSKAAPFLTLDKAITTAATGQVIHVNGATHKSSTFYAITKGVGVYPSTPYGVRLRATASSRVLSAEIADGSTATFGKFVVDAENGASRACVLVAAKAVKFGMTFRGTRFENFATNVVNAVAANTKIDLAFYGVGFTTALGGSAIFASGWVEGSLTINGATVDMATSTTDAYVAYVTAQVSGYVGVSVNISGVVGAMNASAGTGAFGMAHIRNVPGVVIQNCDFTATGTRRGIGAWVTAQVTSPKDASNPVIANNEFTILTPTGQMILVGQDDSTAADGLCNDALVYGNRITSDLAGSAAVHGIEIGFVDGATVYGNHVGYGYVGLLAKGTTGNVRMFNNFVHGSGSVYAVRAKGAAGAKFYNNTVLMNGGSNGYALYADGDMPSLTPSVDAVFRNNIVYCENPVANGGGLAYCSAAQAGPTAASTAVFDRNLYFSEVALPATPWQYQSTTYADLAAWQAVEANAMQDDPAFVDTTDFRLTSGSPAKSAGVSIAGLTTDYYGATRGDPPSVGAVE